MEKDTKGEVLTPLVRTVTADNPIILEKATRINQPNNLAYNAQIPVNLNQSKIILQIIKRLQEPIRQTIINPYYRENPQQLSLFQEDQNDYIQLDFLLSEFNVDASNYRKLRADAKDLLNLRVKEETVYYNKLVGGEIEAEAFMPLFYKVLLPKKYERHISFQITKSMAQRLVNVGDGGYTKFLLEFAMERRSKYSYLMYQILSGYKDQGGVSLTIDFLKEKLGLVGQYNKFDDFHTRVIKTAYRELYHQADVWFEYTVEKKQGKHHKINFKIIKGYYLVLNNSDEVQEREPIHLLDMTKLTPDESNIVKILRDELLITDIRLLAEILSSIELQDKFKSWWATYHKRIGKMDSPSSLLLYHLGLTQKQGFVPKEWTVIESPEVKAQTENREKWRAILSDLYNVLDKPIIDRVFVPCTIVHYDNKTDTIILRVPNQAVVNEIEANYIPQLKPILRSHYTPSARLRYSIPK